MPYQTPAHVTKIGIAIQVADLLGFTKEQIARLLGIEIRSNDEMRELMIAITSFHFVDVERRAGLVVQLNEGFGGIESLESLLEIMRNAQEALGGRSLHDLLTTGKEEDLAAAVNFVRSLKNG